MIYPFLRALISQLSRTSIGKKRLDDAEWNLCKHRLTPAKEPSNVDIRSYL
jgi:hypothetical protein